MRTLFLAMLTAFLLATLLVEIGETQTQQPDAIISWTPPSAYEDGTILLEQDLDYYTLACNGQDLVNIDSIMGQWTAEIVFPQPGTYACTLRVTTTNGATSAPSNVVSFTKGPRIPRPPVLLE